MTVQANAGSAVAVPKREAGYALVVLTLIWVLNYMDRNILNVLAQPIKEDLGVSDTVLGLMSGFGFVALFSLFAIPLARLADQTNRVAVISGGLAVWSIMTALTGFVASAWQLLLVRAFVGIGEASSAGPTQALLADLFSPAQRGRVMSVLAMATFVGILLAFVVGSALNAKFGWRSAYLICGAPGLVIAALCWLTIKDAKRGGLETPGVDTRAYSLSEALAFLAAQPSYVLIVISFCFAAFCNAVIVAWVAPMLQRVHDMTNAQVGLSVGPLMGFSGIAGALLGIAVMTRLSKLDLRWTIWGPCLAMLAAAPAMVLFCLAPNPRVALAALAFTTVASGFQTGPLIAAVQSVAKVRLRALAGGLTVAASNLTGWGLGPLTVGALSDALTSRFGNDAVRYAMLSGAVALVLAALLLPLAAKRFDADRMRAQ